ncbi:MAG: CHAT domain-containing protein, partial [Bacteroidota bacterium]
AQISEEDLEQERLLRLDIAFYEKQINREKQKKEKVNAKKLKEWETALFDFRTSYDELIAEFEQKYPLYHKLKYDIQTIGLADIRTQLLDDRTAILEYFIGQQNSYLFYVSRTDFKVYPLDRGKVQEEAIRELRGIVGQIPEEKSFLAECGRFNELSAGLYQQLLQPALSAVPESVDRLVLVPDNYLSLLPFGLLIRTQLSENPGNYRLSTFDYLLEDFAISYNYSLTLLSYTQNQILDSGADDFVGFAPVFGKQAAGGRMASRSCFDGELYDLVCNRQEVDYIHQLYGGQAVLAENANKEAFQLVAPQGRILHLATHACADEENIDQSRIHFSNGYITSQELQGMDLKADLAVLSACNTGSGLLIKGEGVMSLSRSFLLAGCASTLVSLWSVDDCATSDVMKYFYTSLSNDLGKDQALREATLQYLAQADKVGSHPYYWGAFVQSGSAVALSKGTSQLLWWLAGGVLLLGLFLFLRRRGGAA